MKEKIEKHLEENKDQLDEEKKKLVELLGEEKIDGDWIASFEDSVREITSTVNAMHTCEGLLSED